MLLESWQLCLKKLRPYIRLGIDGAPSLDGHNFLWHLCKDSSLRECYSLGLARQSSVWVQCALLAYCILSGSKLDCFLLEISRSNLVTGSMLPESQHKGFCDTLLITDYYCFITNIISPFSSCVFVTMTDEQYVSW